MTATLKVLGITDEVTACECCGRSDLKNTVVIGDDDGLPVSYFGRDCAAKTLGFSAKQITRSLLVVAKEQKERADRADRAKRFVEHEAYESWKLAMYGDTTNTLERYRIYLSQKSN